MPSPKTSNHLHRLYGVAPIIISGLLTLLAILVGFVFDGMERSDFFKYIMEGYRIPTDCNALAKGILQSIIFSYYYISVAIIAIAVAECIFSWIYDRVIFIFIIGIGIICTYPMAILYDKDKIIVNITSINSICKSEFQSSVILVQYPLFFFCVYFVVGNAILLIKRSMARGISNG
jgi:hypothetical protein